MKTRTPITLSDQDRARLEVLATSRDVSLSEATRRAILAEYERTQEAEVRPRIEDPLWAELEQVRTTLAELGPQVTGMALRLLALINCSKGRAEIGAELKRLARS